MHPSFISVKLYKQHRITFRSTAQDLPRDGWKRWPRRSELQWDWFQRLSASEQAHCGRNSHFLMHKLLFLQGSTRFQHFFVFFGRSFYEAHCHIHLQQLEKKRFWTFDNKGNISIKKTLKNGRFQYFFGGSASMNQEIQDLRWWAVWNLMFL